MDQQARPDDRTRQMRSAVGVAAVLLVLALWPYTASPAYDIKRLVVHIAGLILAVLWVQTAPSAVPAARRPISPIAWLWGGLLALNTLAAVFSAHAGHSMESLSWQAGLFLLYLLASAAFQTAEHANGLFRYLLLAMLAATVYGVLQQVGLDPFPWRIDADSSSIYRRWPATFGNPNLAGHTLVIAIAAGAALCVERRSRWVWAVIPLLLVHLIMTAHRGGALAVAVATATVVLALFARRKTAGAGAPHKALPAFVVAIAVVVLVSICAIPLVRNHHFGMSSVLRINSFYGACRMVVDGPLLGYGPGNYEIDSVPYWTPLEQREYALRRRCNTHVHNELLQSAVDAGLPAAVLYAALLLTAAATALYTGLAARSRREAWQPFVFAGLFAGFFVDGLFGFNLTAPASGGLLALTLGCFDGIYLRREVPAPVTGRWKTKACTAAVVLLALVNAVFGARLFVAQWLLQRGQGAAAWNAHEDAQRMFDRGARLAPWDWRFPYNGGVLAQTRQDYPAATAFFEKALAANPNYIPALMGGAQTAFETGVNFPERDDAFDLSQRFTQRALDLCPSLAEAHENLGRLALQRAREFKEQLPTTQQAFQKELDAAERHFAETLVCLPENQAEINLLMAQVCVLRDDLARAQLLIAGAADIEPDNPAVWEMFSSLAARTKAYAPLVDALTRALETASGSGDAARRAPALYVFLAKAQMKAGATDQAELALRQAITLDPARGATWDAVAAYADALGNDDRLRLLVQQAVATLKERGQATPPVLEAASALWEPGSKGLERAARTLYDLATGWSAQMPPAVVDSELGWVVKRAWARAQEPTAADSVPGPVALRLGYLLYRCGALEAAARGLAKAANTVTGEEAIACAQYRAQVLAAMGRYPEAEVVLIGAIAANPRRLEPRALLIQVLTMAGDTERAQQERQAYEQVRRALDPNARKLAPELKPTAQ